MRNPPSGITGFLSWLVLPSLVAGVGAATLALLARGLPPPAVSAAMIVCCALIILALERVAPLHRAWNRRPEALDLALIVGNRLIDIAVVAGTLALVARLGRPLALWPTTLPLPAQAALGILLAEGIRYALHRASHLPGILGRWHGVHHQPERMYALNGPRLHPGNQLWIAVANVVPMLVLGARLEAVVLAANLTVFFVLFQHANLCLRFDGWNRVFATPDVHRLHHLRSGEEVNFGIVLLVYDRLFGTYRAAPEEEPTADAIGYRLAA
jgi:sterol desaturase/sphingolipid hydroxylase (fatty acid hydroxylase superfamily)